MTENNAAQPGQDPLFEAIDILTVAADELRHSHALGNSFDDWTGEPEAKAEYDRTLRVVAALSKLRAEGVQAGDERAAFEAHMKEKFGGLVEPWDARRGRYGFGPDNTRWEGWHDRAALASAPVAMIDTAKLAQLLDSVNGDCYLGKEKEEELVQSLRSQLRARVAEPEWIDDPHDIEQGMMRNPKYVAPGHKPVDTSSGHSAPVAGEAQGVSVERLAKDPFLAAQLWRNPVDRAPVAGEALTAEDVERQYRDGVHIGSGLPRATCPCGFCSKHRHGFERGDDLAAPQASEAVHPSIPPAKPLPDLMMASYHEAIGWNACRAAMLQSTGQADKDGGPTEAQCKEAAAIARSFGGRTMADVLDGGDCAKGAGAVAMRDAAFEAVRKRLCAIPRYSFYLDDDGVVRRVEGRSGNWIEFDAAHELFDPVAVDAALSPTPSAVKQSLTATQTGEKGEKDA